MTDMTLLANSVSSILSLSGTEVTGSRRYVDLLDCQAIRVQFKASASIQVRIEGSADDGSTWFTVLPEDNYSGVNPYISTWTVLPQQALVNNCLLRGIGIGTGLLVTVDYIEVQYR